MENRTAVGSNSSLRENRSNGTCLTSKYVEESHHELQTWEEESQAGGWRSHVKTILWHGGSSFDAWLNAASIQIAQVLLTFPYSFAQLGLASGIAFQLLYGLIGCWTCYMITCLYADYRNKKENENVSFENHTIQWFEVLGGLLGPWWKTVGLVFNAALLFSACIIQLIACGSTVYYINDALPKRTWTIIFGGCCLSTVLIPTVHNYRILSFFGIIMTSYTAWYLTIAAAVHGQIPHVKHRGANSLIEYFTGATNMLYSFGGHAVTVEIMHAMWKPKKFKLVYLYAIIYIFTLTIPSAATTYWAYGDILLHNSNALAVLPKTIWRDSAVVLMLMHQLIEIGLLALPVYILWEKLFGMHQASFYLKVIIRIPVVLLFWFFALMIPFFGPINSVVGAVLVTFSVFIIPCAAHMAFYSSPIARKNAKEQPPFWMPSWAATYVVNVCIIMWILVVGVGLGGWASVKNMIQQVNTFGFFTKCFQCPPKH